MNLPSSRVGTAAPAVGKVLIVEDDNHIRELLCLCARRFGYMYAEARNAQEALQCLQSDPEIDVVLSDVWMPGISGVELLDTLHRDYPHIPVALISGQATLQTSLDALNMGAFAYIVKPFQPEQIRDVLARGLSKSRQQKRIRELQTQLDSSREQVKALHTFVGDLKQELQEFATGGNPRINEGLSELILGLRHELGNLATAILLNLSDMSVRSIEANDGTLQNNISDLQMSAQDLAQLVNRLTEFPRKDDTIEEFDLRPAVEQAVRMTADQFAHAEISFESLKDSQHVWGDFSQVSRALTQIIENACKFGDAEHPRVSVRMSRQQPTANAPTDPQRPPRDTIRISVRDNGQGFTAGAIEAAFSPGYTTRITEGFVRGLGMGLFIARATAELYGGRVHARNLPEGGAEVTMELPAVYSLNVAV